MFFNLILQSRNRIKKRFSNMRKYKYNYKINLKSVILYHRNVGEISFNLSFIEIQFL